MEEDEKTNKARRFLGTTQGAILIISNGIKVFEFNCRVYCRRSVNFNSNQLGTVRMKRGVF
jgi:hypothetical protein